MPPSLNFAQLRALAVQTFKSWTDDYAPSMGAAIAYYTVFSLAPLLVIVIAIAGAVFGREAVTGQIAAQMQGLVGEQGATFVQSLLAASSNTHHGLIAGLISAVVLVVGATSVFTELQSALDRIWHVPAAQKPKGVVQMLRARLLSFGVVLTMVFLLMVSLTVSAALAALGSWGSGLSALVQFLAQALNIVLSLGVSTVLFGFIYKTLPSVKLAWRDVIVGAVATAVLFEVGKFLIGLYLGHSSMSQAFAAAGSLVVLIAWVYYAAQIFLLGAEFTKVYAHAHGTKQDSALPAPVAPTRSTAGLVGAQGDAVPLPVARDALPVTRDAKEREPAAVSAAIARLEDTRQQFAEELPLRVEHVKTVAKRASTVGGVAVALGVAAMQWQKRRRSARGVRTSPGPRTARA